MRSMLAQGAGAARRFQAAALLAVTLAGCAVTPPPALEPKPAAQVPAPAPAAAPGSAARTIAEYGTEVAELLHDANRQAVFEGRPPNPLRAVIVVYVEVDAGGILRTLHLYRAPAHAGELLDEVERAWRRLGPVLPRPREALVNGDGRLAFTQTWLFDKEGRFQLRPLARMQVEPPGGD
jgi:protein TonB